MLNARELSMAITLSPGQASDKAAVADRGGDAPVVPDTIAGHGGRGLRGSREGPRRIAPRSGRP